MKIGFLQFAPKFGEIEKNLKRIEELISDVEANLLVLPELATTGYAFESKAELLTFAKSIPGPSIERLTSLATAKNMWLVVGIAEKVESNIYDSSVLISPKGDFWVYRKLHLFFREKLIFTQGNSPLNVINAEGVKLGLLICFDWVFPEAVRTLAIKGAQIICHSANLVFPYCQPGMQTRAIENRVFIITANRTGVERGCRFTGKSQIVNPKGEVILKSGSKEEGAKVIEIDPKEAIDKSLNEYNDLFKDRRVDMYSL